MPREHTMPVITLARTLAEGGWGPTEIQRRLAADGHTVSRDAIRRWTVPGYAAAQDARRMDRKRAARGEPAALRLPEMRMQRLRMLNEAGMSYESCAILARVDFGVTVDADGVRRLLKGSPSRRTIAKHLGAAS